MQIVEKKVLQEKNEGPVLGEQTIQNVKRQQYILNDLCMRRTDWQYVCVVFISVYLCTHHGLQQSCSAAVCFAILHYQVTHVTVLITIARAFKTSHYCSC